MSNAPAATTPAPGPRINARRPTGQVGYPLILLAGEEFGGKSLVPAVLSRSDKVGMTYWIDLGEGVADDYAVLPGADYMVIEHDGTYRAILEQIAAVWHEANRAHLAGEPPVVLVLDSISAEWTMLVNWTNDRARRSRNGQRKLAQDPDAEIDPTSNLWNDANKRHARIMNLLMTFPGIAIVTARGKDVTVMDESGQPTKEKVRKPEGQKGLAYDVDAYIWMSREPRRAELMGVRSLRVMVPEGETLVLPTTKVGPWNVLDLEAFIFDLLGATGPKQEGSLQRLRGDELEGILDLVGTIGDETELKDLWDRVNGQLPTAQRDELKAIVTARLTTIRTQAEGNTGDDVEPSLQAHGPDSDAEKLRQAAEAQRQAQAGEPERESWGEGTAMSEEELQAAYDEASEPNR